VYVIELRVTAAFWLDITMTEVSSYLSAAGARLLTSSRWKSEPKVEKFVAGTNVIF
jgi:hypothetical protein